MPEFTARNVAKFVATSLVRIRVTKLAQDTIVDHTDFDSDSTAVNIVSGLVGWGVSDKLKPYTDAAVDKVADKVAEMRAKQQDKKNTK